MLLHPEDFSLDNANVICISPLLLHFNLDCMEYFELEHGKNYGNKCDFKNFESNGCYFLRVHVLNNNPECRKLFYDTSI
jgi:hypothetical protein